MPVVKLSCSFPETPGEAEIKMTDAFIDAVAQDGSVRRNPNGRSVKIADMGYEEAVALKSALEDAFAEASDLAGQSNAEASQVISQD